MTVELKTILRDTNIQRAVVVDDGYDEVPLAKNLTLEAADWDNFFDDLLPEDEAMLVELYPQYHEFRADELRSNDEFVATLWQNRTTLRPEIIEPLFAGFSAGKELDRDYLKTVTDFLSECGLAIEKAGSSFEDQASKADLVIIDLFLGTQQDEDAMQRAITGLKRVIERRPDRPPVVILMSRNHRLEAKRSIFRDEVGLFESAFRVVSKTELKAQGKLQRLLTRLASHYPQSIQLASFLNAWKTGLASAADRTAKCIRTLDLPDHAQIKNLLLNEEGEPPGSYIVDVFDRVLQHEVEGESAIINAALALNQLETAAYPPLYISGSRDFQSMVFRTLFQHKERLRLVSPTASAVAFGDLLRRKDQTAPTAAAAAAAAAASKAPAFFASIGAHDVLLVITPACDLQRQKAKRCLLLRGTLIRLQRENLASKDHPTRTTVYEDNQGERHLISWDLQHVESASEEELRCLLKSADGFEIVARLRDSHALELQQKLLANLGRVGRPAPMPATFTAQVKAYLPSVDTTLLELPIPALNDHPCVMYQAQRGGSQLVFTEDACEAICQAISSMDLNQVHRNTRSLISQLQTSNELLLLEQGVGCSNLKDGQFLQIYSPKPDVSGSRTVALLRKNGDWVNGKLEQNWLAKAGVILAVTFS